MVRWRSFVPKLHWSPRYLYDRVRLEAWQAVHPGAPWLAPEAVRFLGRWLTGTETVVEFGSGRSTVWFARRAAAVVSVEHDAKWHERVGRRLEAIGAKNVHPLLEAGGGRSYVVAAKPHLTEAPSLVLVDGACRDLCALWALDHCRPGGLIVIDNAERYLPSGDRGPEAIGWPERLASSEWREFRDRAEDHRQLWFDCGVFSTLVVFA